MGNLSQQIPSSAKQVPNFPMYYATPDGRVFTTYKYTHEIALNTKDKDGYLKIALMRLDGEKWIRKDMRKHRVIALTFLGESNLLINHKNQIKTDNRIENLEYVDNRENQSHWRRAKGFDIGVCFDKKTKKWRAYYQQDHKWEHLGFFADKKDAKVAYLNKLKAENKLNKYAV